MDLKLIPANLEQALSHTDTIHTLCQPLFSDCIINYFNYVRKYQDGSNTCVTSHSDWTKYFYENKLYSEIHQTIDSVLIKPNQYGVLWYYWYDFPQCSARLIAEERFNIGKGLAIISAVEEYADFYYLGSAINTPYDKLLSYFSSHFSDVIRFIYYFHEQWDKFLEELYLASNRILIPAYKKQENRIFIKTNELRIPESTPFEFPITKFRILLENKIVYLSLKETQCLSLYVKGFSPKLIAYHLHISPRTVETYLGRIKYKLFEVGFDVSTKDELLPLLGTKPWQRKRGVISQIELLDFIIWDEKAQW